MIGGPGRATILGLVSAVVATGLATVAMIAGIQATPAGATTLATQRMCSGQPARFISGGQVTGSPNQRP